jgi:uncharacterized protein YllA (UPF0747 family)
VAKAQTNIPADRPLSALQIGNLPLQMQQALQKRIRLEAMPRLGQQVSFSLSRLKLEWRASPAAVLIHQQPHKMHTNVVCIPVSLSQCCNTLLAVAARG